MSNNQYLELSHYNDNQNDMDATLRYTGSNFLDNQTMLWAMKFKISSSNFPLFVPTIIDTFIPYNVNDTTILQDEHSLPNHITDWAITVVYNNNTQRSSPILWEKPGTVLTTSSDLFLNKYFWLENSDQLTIMINNAFNRLVPNNKIIIAKDSDRWTLLTHTDLDIKSIHFNDNMKQFFSFNYGIRNEIILSNIQTFAILDEVYYSNTTPHSNNKLFPFDKIVWKSDEINTPNLKMQEFNSNMKNNSSCIILSYDLSVTDISSIATSMAFTSDNRDRSLTLNTSRLSAFTVAPFLVTKDGTEYRIKLAKGDKTSITMCFY